VSSQGGLGPPTFPENVFVIHADLMHVQGSGEGQSAWRLTLPYINHLFTCCNSIQFSAPRTQPLLGRGDHYSHIHSLNSTYCPWSTPIFWTSQRPCHYHKHFTKL